jgi:hypothetical protein
MKKFSVLIALVLLAVAGTGYAVTCAYDNVPAATLLVPYWKVSLNGATGYPIPGGGTDTLVSIVNVSTPGVIAHVTVWNKYSKAVIDFNLPLTGKDAVSFSMRAIMNGALSPNLPQYDTAHWDDPCGLLFPGDPIKEIYKPDLGFNQNQFIRFSHPDSASWNPQGVTDANLSISQYNINNPDAIQAGFRPYVWDSLDESGDITSFTSSGTRTSGNILDGDNPACNATWTDGSTAVYRDALSGYLTIDVVNYCTNFFPDEGFFYTKDAIATTGWTGTYPYCSYTALEGWASCAVTYTPNVLIGDVFFVDSNAVGGNISGDPAVAVEFDSRLAYAANGLTKTFFGKFVATQGFTACAAEATPTGCVNANVPTAFQFGGDGREPLGDRYGFRYLADSVNGLQSWITVWRSDMYKNVAGTAFDQFNLCSWAAPTTAAPGPAGKGGAAGWGLYDSVHQVQVLTYDNDEGVYGGVGVPPGPSGNKPPAQGSALYIFLESQRINLLTATDWNPAHFPGGWVDLTLRGPGYTGATVATGLYNQGWVGVQHTAPGQFISVGHAAANLNNQFQCSPNTTAVGNTVVTGAVFP